MNQVLALPFIRKEMGNYIQTQLGDDSAADMLYLGVDMLCLLYLHLGR